MDWGAIIVLVMGIVGAFLVGGVLGYYTGRDVNDLVKYKNNNLKRENERLNAEIHKLTDRDSRGRFKGNSK